MNREDIIRMAREAGMETDDDGSEWGPIITAEPADLERLATLVAAERDKHWHQIIHDECEAVIAETNRKANASWTRMCEKMVAAEREACAQVCDDQAQDEPYGHAKFRCANIAAAIRARGQ